MSDGFVTAGSGYYQPQRYFGTRKKGRAVCLNCNGPRRANDSDLCEICEPVGSADSCVDRVDRRVAWNNPRYQSAEVTLPKVSILETEL